MNAPKTTWSAIVLAGARPGGDPFAAAFGTDLKALIPVAGEPMIRRPVRALLASGSIGGIAVLAQNPERIAGVLAADPRLEVRKSSPTIAATILDLCADPATPWPLLVTTADHALLDLAMIDEFCRKAAGSDIALAVVERSALLRRLPQSKRTWVPFKGNAYSGANLFALRSPSVAPAIRIWRSVEEDRKKGLRILALFGPVVLLGALLRLIGLDEALARVSRKLGIEIRAVRMDNPLAAVDVDKASDHELVEAVLQGRA